MEMNELTSKSEQFDFDSGNLSLDFANTLNWSASDHPEDDLGNFAGLVAWGLEAKLIPPEQAHNLINQGEAQTEWAQGWFSQAIELREAIYHIFAADAHGEPVSPADIDILTAYWRRAAQAMRIQLIDNQPGWEWEFGTSDGPQRILWPVVRSAVDLLQSELRDRVGQCEDDRGCGFLFVDTSRNRSRRWCSMESCGNRAKAQRHYSKSKK